jgi:hypothetical protein
MFISVGRDGKLALCEPDDFKRLHIEAADGDLPLDDVAGRWRRSQCATGTTAGSVWTR